MPACLINPVLYIYYNMPDRLRKCISEFFIKLSEKLLNYFSLDPVKCWREKGECGSALCYDMKVLTISQITVSNNQSRFSIMFTNVGPMHVLLNRIRILHKPFTHYNFEHRPDWRWDEWID